MQEMRRAVVASRGTPKRVVDGELGLRADRDRSGSHPASVDDQAFHRLLRILDFESRTVHFDDAAIADLPTLLLTALVGALLHGVYLGSVFFALSVGLSAGISALIVSLQPILASFLAIFLFAERLRRPQIAGIAIGLLGVVLVLWPKLGGAMPALGLASVTIGLVAITGGTLLQKRIGNRMELLAGNVVQTIAASLFFAVICSTVETPRISWELPFVIALTWQVVMVSAGAYLILMVLIQRDSMAATSSLLFLVPPVTAVIAAIGFDEPLTLFSLTGFAVTSAGVYLVTRYKAP